MTARLSSDAASRAQHPRRAIWGWALYDWANSAFATTVIAGLFPIFFKREYAAGLPAVESSFRLGVATSLASLVVAIASPILGAAADNHRSRKRWLLLSAALGITGVVALAQVGRGDWANAVLCFALANVGWSLANVFYDSLLVEVAPVDQRERVSSLGFSLGYLGGGLLFAVNVMMVQKPPWFGLHNAAAAVRWSFLSVAVWWLVFCIPLALWVKESSARAILAAAAVAKSTLSQLAATFRTLLEDKRIFTFLIAYWLYIDGVDTVIRMAVDYGTSLGFPTKALISALLLVQFVGFPAALLFGWLGEKFGATKLVLIGIGIYALLTVFAAGMQNERQFFALAAVVGLVQGGVQALSRSIYSQLIPAERASEYFGFYGVLGKFATILGPVMVGTVARLTGSPRYGIVSIVPLFLIGGFLLTRVKLQRSAA